MDKQIHWHSFKAGSVSFRLGATPRGLYSLEFGKRARLPRTKKPVPSKVRLLIKRTASLLKAYLDAKSVSFENLPVDWSGYEDSQREVLEELRKIPRGRTESYQFLAQQTGRPKAARYIGNVLGSNRLPIVLPCHRIIRKGGGMGGFSKGLRWKKWLLKLEGAGVDTQSQARPGCLTAKGRVL